MLRVSKLLLQIENLDAHKHPVPGTNLRVCSHVQVATAQMQDTSPATCRLTFRQRFDVEVVSTSFRMPMWEALALVRSSDMFLGMHGAGFANLLGMHKVGFAASARRPVVPSTHH